MPRTSSYIDKIKQCFENHEEESESKSKKEISEKIITRLVTGTSSQSRNQETCDQEKELDIREATFRNTQRNIIPPPLRPISPLTENGDKIATPYIARLTDFSREKEEMNVHIWLKKAQKVIQTNNWNNQRAIQTLPFFLKDTANLWYQSLETKLTSFTKFKNALLEYFSNSNAIIQLQNKFNTIKQGTGETVTQYLARFNQICHQIEAIKQGYYTDPQVLNQFIRGLKNSILGRVCSVHSNSLPEAITLTKALESVEKKANHSQIVNMVMEKNKTETLKKRENKAMFSGATLNKKHPITAMYTKATVNNIPIKLILNSGSTGSIIILQLVNQLGFKVDCTTTSQIITADESTKLSYGKIDSFPFEINGIVIPTKVLVMDATQYQALVRNNWLTKANTTLNWTIQELLINYNGHQTRIPATCGHFQKPSTNQRPIFEFEENPVLPAIEIYQLSWADDQRTELPAVPM
ncbi:hypothetical protein G9A89_007059 [Geosiphon pyriformis]|nr:hypothetical protein G9A89_007059 [Geosiphon pyriformis]